MAGNPKLQLNLFMPFTWQVKDIGRNKMRFTLIPRFKPFLGFSEFIRIFLPARSDAVSKFEQEFAKKMQQKYAIAFPYGRTGLIFLLKSLGLEGKEIICPAYTCAVVPHAIVFSGNIPVFVDSQLKDFNMDLDLVEEAISDKTGAIIATSIFGNPVNLDRLAEIKNKYPHIHIIQDCAHSFGAEWDGVRVNTAGVAAIYGLNVSKIITSVFGGMVTTDSRDVYENLKVFLKENLKPIGRAKSLKRRLYLLTIYMAFNSFIYSVVDFLERHGFLNRFVKYFDEKKIDMPSDYLDMMSPFEAEIGAIQSEKYDEIIAKRRNIGYLYDELLEKSKEMGKTFSHYPVLVSDRKKVLSDARKNGIQLGTIIDYSCENMQVYKEYRFVTRDHVVDRLRKHMVNLPMVDMKKEQREELQRILCIV
ncbi:MAG TPA: hypothetical protein DEG23_01795 [Coxiellaceae bacterium]|nr:hypothetical protein [Coxiellaceae bacterium]